MHLNPKRKRNQNRKNQHVVKVHIMVLHGKDVDRGKKGKGKSKQ